MELDVELEAELDLLYALPLEGFIRARDELAKQLRQAGARDTAAKVKKLAKPSHTAWAVNQLYFRARPQLAALVAAGDEMRAAHLAGGAAHQQATKAKRQAQSTLLDLADDYLSTAGHAPSRANRQRISRTLEAVASRGTLDADGDAPRPGRLAQDLEPPGFDVLADLSAALAQAAANRPAPDAEPDEGSNEESADEPAPSTKPRPQLRLVPPLEPDEPRPDPAAERRARLRQERLERARRALAAAEEKATNARSEADAARAEQEAADEAAARESTAAREAERLAREAEERAEAARRRESEARTAAVKARRDAEAAAAAAARAEKTAAEARAEVEGIEAD